MEAPFGPSNKESIADAEDQLGNKILEFVKTTDSGYSSKLKIANLNDISGVGVKLHLGGLKIRMRDLPLQIADIGSVHIEASIITLRYVSRV